MIILKEIVEKVLRAEARFINSIREDGMTPDDFSEKEFLEGVIEEIEHPTNFNKLE